MVDEEGCVEGKGIEGCTTSATEQGGDREETMRVERAEAK